MEATAGSFDGTMNLSFRTLHLYREFHYAVTIIIFLSTFGSIRIVIDNPPNFFITTLYGLLKGILFTWLYSSLQAVIAAFNFSKNKLMLLQNAPLRNLLNADILVHQYVVSLPLSGAHIGALCCH